MRPTALDDDEVTGLPASDGDQASEAGTEPFEPDAEDDGAEESEDVGLDAATGIDEPLDADLELQHGDEGASLLQDSEAAEDLATGEDDLGGDDEEYGYTEESEPLNDEGLYEGAIVISDEGSALEDRGEEGFGDDTAGSVLDLEALPPLDSDPETEREIDEPAEGGVPISLPPPRASEPPQRPSQPTITGVRLGNARVRVEVLQRSGRPLRMLCAAGGTGIAWDGTLLTAGPSDPRPDRRYAGAEAIGGLAALDTGKQLEIALVTPEALLVSSDGGRTCRARTDWPDRVPASSVALLRSPRGGVRLIAAAPMGHAYASDDGGPFTRLPPESGVVRLSSDDRQSVLALIRSETNEPLLALSTDGGETFETMPAPVDALERVQDVQIAGLSAACARRAPEPRVLWTHTDSEVWHEAVPDASCPMRLIEERHGSVIYSVVPRGDRAAIVRRELPEGAAAAGSSARGELIAELPRDIGAVLQLAAGHQGGITTLHVGTERAWLRITVLPGGSDA
jgi:hypothetical protein